MSRKKIKVTIPERYEWQEKIQCGGCAVMIVLGFIMWCVIVIGGIVSALRMMFR